MDALRLRAIRTYPERGGPAVEHHTIAIAAAGLAGDRPKKAAVSLVGTDSPHTRANLVLDAPTVDLEDLDGRVVRIGEVRLALQRTGNSCSGLYASVGGNGRVTVGDLVTVEAAS